MAPMQEPRDIQNDIHREARLLLRAARAGSLAVIEDEYPAIALVTPAVTPEGDVVVLLSQLSAHTRALDRDPRCALMVSGPPAEANPQTSPRLSLVCDAARSDAPEDRERYLAIHPYARGYAGFTDFGIYRLSPVGARFVGGFARAATLDVERLAPRTAALQDQAACRAAMAAANDGLGARLDEVAARHGGSGGGWRMVALDPDGFDLGREDIVLRVAFGRMLRVYEDALTNLADGATHG
jgi:putative heme iron utilization protein